MLDWDFGVVLHCLCRRGKAPAESKGIIVEFREFAADDNTEITQLAITSAMAHKDHQFTDNFSGAFDGIAEGLVSVAAGILTTNMAKEDSSAVVEFFNCILAVLEDAQVALHAADHMIVALRDQGRGTASFN